MRINLYVYVIMCLCLNNELNKIMKHKIAMMLLVPALMLGAVGCAGPSNHTERGAATGAVLGGLTGAIIGHNKGRHGAEGAAIGAVVGGLLGGAVGNQQDKNAGYK